MDNVKQYSKLFKENSFSSRNVVVKLGILPLIITAPHGGLDKPQHIPDRQQDGSLLLADMHTKEIAEEIGKKVHDHYSKAPHVILNSISRRKTDVNRPLSEGAETKNGEQVWKEYHNHVNNAVDTVLKKYGYGLLIDVHGHTHAHGMVELGYLLEPHDLKCSSVHHLDQTILQKSSIRSLAKRHLDKKRPHKFLRPFGDSIIKKSNKNIVVVPSTHQPEPTDDESYFFGGYTTQYYHYRDGLDVIQVELPKDLRFSKSLREILIKSVSHAIIDLIDEYYSHTSRL